MANETAELLALFEEYHQLAHAMQSGVGFAMHRNPTPTEPKHLRVGVNAAMVEHGALVKLLTEKGVITELEYATALRDMMKLEVEKYEKLLGELYDTTVTLR